ncbi:hypothetical protein TRFO_12447 [Tritrichomonas foetus]|uniref:Uncharacterized protein n=1 Tax=Tritrichomonas foetus TaxID=1144522 RepID=A0A1J4L5T8_9EUKA|nr:hypothetical protein TRFO_12447 [Tritrichomonas foetus]|eukprot:OHT17309.1 hypothetical protein TRFO_12447 [Tritrichomonas foetus]
MNHDDVRLIEELNGQEALERARQDAEADAFKFVSDSISNSSNLESLEQIKQTVFNKHQNKIAFLKARVQGIVTNIETGINDLVEISTNLTNLKSDIKSIEEESSSGVVVLDNFKILQGLATIWERAIIIDELMESFKTADDTIEMISKYFDENEKAFSIKLFTTIESLIDFENDLLTNVDDIGLKRYVQSRFEKVHQCREKMIDNVHDCLENALEQNVDQLIRANWIMVAIDEHDKITEYLRSAITRQTYAKMQDIDRNNVSLYLQKLSGMIETLPEQLELLIPALPSDINALELTTSYINTEIYKMLVNYKDSMPLNAALIDAMIKCMKDIECTLNALLGVSPSHEFYELCGTLQNTFEVILFEDYQKFLDNIISLDIDSVATKRDGMYYTPGPKDLIDRLFDAYNFVKGSVSNVVQGARPKLVNKLADAFVNLTNSAADSWDMKYIMAMINNSVDAVKQIADFAKANEDIIKTTEEIKKLQRPWSDMKNRGLPVLAQIIYSRAVSCDDDFRSDFEGRIDAISEALSDVSKHLFQPLYKKLVSVVTRELVPHYIQSFFMKSWEKPKTQEELESLITSECNALADMFSNLEQLLCKGSIETIEAFRDFMIEPYDVLHDIFHIIAKEYNDFTPGLAMALLKLRVDVKDNKSDYNECWSAFEMMYQNVDQSRGDSYFNQENAAKKGILK